MRNWRTYGGGAVWMLVAVLMASAALQPVEVSRAAVAGNGAGLAASDGGAQL
jgi:hypothetical protein